MDKIIKLINNSKTVAILAHDSEDADAVGSSYALKLVLLELGKDAECYFSARPEMHLEFLGENYKLLDEDNLPEVDLCICLDSADFSRIGSRKVIFDAAKHTALIDHHATNTGFAEENYIDSLAPATGEILYTLFEKMDIKMNAEVAKNLYSAISADTGSFKYSNVRPHTMEIVAKLLTYNINHSEIARKLFDDEPIETIKFKGFVMQNIEQYFDNKLNLVAVRKAEFEKFGVKERDTGDIVNIPRAVLGCEIAVSIRETSEKIKISFRSNGKYDVSALAQKFGGGGHKMAAGAIQKNKTLDEVKNEIIKVCEEVFNG